MERPIGPFRALQHLSFRLDPTIVVFCTLYKTALANGRLESVGLTPNSKYIGDALANYMAFFNLELA